MKHYLLLVLACLLSFGLLGQCPEGSVNLRTQAEVDAYVAAFPNCATIPGYLLIGSYWDSTDITDISGLGGLRNVESYINITNNPNLSSLAGLDNLQRVGGSMQIFDNDSIVSLDELEHLLVIEDGLLIQGNRLLRSIDGIRNVEANRLNTLNISYNRQLSNCAIGNICNYLSECIVEVSIHRNAEGCQTDLEVRSNCSSGESYDTTSQAVVFSEGEILDIQLSDDGTHLFVARQIYVPTNREDAYQKDLLVNVFEWNGQGWTDLGQSTMLNSGVYISNSNHSNEFSFLYDFSENGSYFAAKIRRTGDNYIVTEYSSVGVRKWEGGNNWSYVSRPNRDWSSYSFSVASYANVVAEAYHPDLDPPYVYVTGNGFQRGVEIRNGDANYARPIMDLMLSRDGSRLAVDFYMSGRGTELKLYEWSGTQWVNMRSSDHVLSEATFTSFSPDGNYLLCSYDDTQRYYGWDGTAWILQEVFQDISRGTSKWYISADNRRIYTNFQGRSWLWDGQLWNESYGVFPDYTCSKDITVMSADLGTLAMLLNPNTIIVNRALPEAGFRYQLSSVCAESDPRIFEQVVSPVGGLFSGVGVSEGTEAGSFVFDPTVAGIGTHEISYTVEADTFFSTITVVAVDPPVLNLPDTLRINEPGLRQIPGMGSPLGGVYADDNGYIVDGGNGQTFNIHNMPEIAQTTITYTVVDENACQSTASKTVVLVNASPNAGGPYLNQVGRDLYATNSAGQYGYSVSLSADGTRMAVGDPNKNDGEVYVYHLEGGEWVEKAILIAGYRQVAFGAQVAMSGDGSRLIVAAPETWFSNYSGTLVSITGSSQMYRWDGTRWISMGGNYGFLYSGSSVDISYDGTTVVIMDTASNYHTNGNVEIYQDTGSSLVRDRFVDNSFPFYYKVNSVAMSADGKRVLISRSTGVRTKKVATFEWQHGDWVQLGASILSVSVDYNPDLSLDITDDGNRIVIGIPQSELPDAPGYVQVYDWNGTDWVQAGADLVGSAPGVHFGKDVAISGDGTKLIVSAPNSDTAAIAAGRAAIYVWDGSAWQEVEETLFGGDRAYDQFGFSVAASADAGTVAIGAIQKDNPLSGGYVRVFAPCIPFNLQNKFSAICANVDPLTELGGGCPTGGVYSGPGVTDNGDGETFTFDPSLSGVGEISITYQLDTLAYTNTIEVLPSPELSLALPDTLVLQSGMPVQITGTGLPTGGVYRNPGGLLIDNADGLNLYYDGTISFDTLQTIHYQYTNSEGCTETISTEITTIVASFQHAMSTVCANAEAVTNLGGGYPTGGSYSGPGVTDHGNGQSFTFDPAQAGVGEAIIIYTLDTLSLTNSIEVLPLPDVTLSLPDTLFVTSGQSATLAGSGLPTGGIYTSTSGLFTDAGNGTQILYSGEADFADTQTIHYTYTDAQGCTQTASAEVVVVAQVVGTNDLPEQVQALHLFPNPTSDQVQLQLHCTEVADLQLQLYDLLGQQLWQSPLIQDRQLTQTLDLTAYPAGTYWLKVRVGEAWLSRRVVKVR